MNRTGVIVPPEEDPDATDRLPALDVGRTDAPADPLESTGTWSSSSAELADRVASLERALEERDAAVADLTSLLRQRTFALTRAEKELEQARSELLRARMSADRATELEQRLGEVERGRAELAARHDEQRAVIGRLEDQLSEAREAEQGLERQLLALREEADAPSPPEDAWVATLTHQLRDERAARRDMQQDLATALAQEREARLRAERALAEREERLGRLEAEVARSAEDLARVRSPTAVRPARRCLVRLDPGQEAVFDLAPPRVSIGRTPDNDLLVRESYISRSHAVIRLGPDSAVIEDLASRNGVFVNDRRVTRELLRDGDVVVLGKARFRFEASPT